MKCGIKYHMIHVLFTNKMRIISTVTNFETQALTVNRSGFWISERKQFKFNDLLRNYWIIKDIRSS